MVAFAVNAMDMAIAPPFKPYLGISIYKAMTAMAIFENSKKNRVLESSYA